jgi:hypothetical protein
VLPKSRAIDGLSSGSSEHALIDAHVAARNASAVDA